VNKAAPAIAVILVLALALLSLYRLLQLQYDSGDAYPVYSSFRADPLGTLILHDAVASTQGAPPRRNLTPLDRATFPPESTLLLAGAGISEDEVATIEGIEAYVKDGGRFVILFRPGQDFAVHAIEDEKERKRTREKREASGENDEDAEKEDRDDPRSSEDDMLDALLPRVDISERWGFAYAIADFPATEKKERVVEVDRGDGAPSLLPENLPWHSTLFFTDLAPEWKTVYTRGAHPVVIERALGDGRIVVASDNYLVSNEAMLADRAPAYLSWLSDPGRTLIFEETHLGVLRSTGVMTLVRQYGLAPVLAVGVLLALLFIWRNAVPLVPKHAAPRAEAAVAAANSTVAGIASLAQRAVRRADVLDTCWKLFQAPAMRKAPIDEARRAAIETALAEYHKTPARRRNPVPTYNHISAIINERKPNP